MERGWGVGVESSQLGYKACSRISVICPLRNHRRGNRYKDGCWKLISNSEIRFSLSLSSFLCKIYGKKTYTLFSLIFNYWFKNYLHPFSAINLSLIIKNLFCMFFIITKKNWIWNLNKIWILIFLHYRKDFNTNNFCFSKNMDHMFGLWRFGLSSTPYIYIHI